MPRRFVHAVLIVLSWTTCVDAGDGKPLKVFILAGQSNMVGWGNSAELPDDLRSGNDRVLMFEAGRWQPLRPHQPASATQAQFGLTEYTFGPEISFAHEMARAWPQGTIGIVKHAVGGTSLLAWKPDWSREDADRVGQGRLGSLYQQLISKVEDARKVRDVDIVACLWLQGGGDMKRLDTAEEYLENLKSFVAAIRKDTGIEDLPFLYGWRRPPGIPDDLTDFVPMQTEPPYPFMQWVVKAQWDAEREISNSHLMVLRDIETHPMNVHYNTAGQLTVGRLFAERFLSLQPSAPAE
ncbi:MAG: sialate O-acetylesterase [Planctomycetaceae bacterium]